MKHKIYIFEDDSYVHEDEINEEYLSMYSPFTWRVIEVEENEVHLYINNV